MEHGDAPSGLDLADVGMLEGQSGLNLVLPDDREDLSHIMPADLAKPVQIRGGCSAPTLRATVLDLNKVPYIAQSADRALSAVLTITWPYDDVVATLPPEWRPRVRGVAGRPRYGRPDVLTRQLAGRCWENVLARRRVPDVPFRARAPALDGGIRGERSISPATSSAGPIAL